MLWFEIDYYFGNYWCWVVLWVFCWRGIGGVDFWSFGMWVFCGGLLLFDCGWWCGREIWMRFFGGFDWCCWGSFWGGFWWWVCVFFYWIGDLCGGKVFVWLFYLLIVRIMCWDFIFLCLVFYEWIELSFWILFGVVDCVCN